MNGFLPGGVPGFLSMKAVREAGPPPRLVRAAAPRQTGRNWIRNIWVCPGAAIISPWMLIAA